MAIVDGHIRCSACRQSKPLAAFYPSIAAKGCGLCRECGKSAYRSDRASDPKRFNNYRRSSKERNPDASRAAAKKWEAKKKAQYIARPPTSGTIRCSSCHKNRQLSEFQPSVVARGCGVCRACKRMAKREYEQRNPIKVSAARRVRSERQGEHARERAREHYRDNPDAYRGYNLARYGIDVAEYESILASQGGACGCCGATSNRNGKRLFVDHDHDTGVIRGILCLNCNRGLSAFGDNIDGVRRALGYLERAQRRLPAPPARQAPTMRINLLPGAN